MKTRIFQIIATLFLLFALPILFSSCESDMTDVAASEEIDISASTRDITGNPIQKACDCLMNEYALEDLSTDEESALLFMREEEKLARDVYLKLYEKWDAQVFSNISKAEQRHMDVILCLINKYELTDPVGDNAPGEFENTDLADLYNTLIAQGDQSLTEALRVGAKIEDLDISDLIEEIDKSDNKDVVAVFEELQKGSRNHLRAFVRNLDMQGADAYAPAYINQEYFDDIISSPKEKGGSICSDCLGNGQGNGNKGKGNCMKNGQGKNSKGNCVNNGQGKKGKNSKNRKGNCDGTGQGKPKGN
jgi:hypothetical protein